MDRRALALSWMLVGGCCWDEATRIWVFDGDTQWSLDVDSHAQDVAVDGASGLWLARTKEGGEDWNLLESEDRTLDLVRAGDEVGAVGWRSDGDVQFSLPARSPATPLAGFEAPVASVRAAGLDDSMLVGVTDANGPTLLQVRAGWSPTEVALPEGVELVTLAARGETIVVADGLTLIAGTAEGEWESFNLDSPAADVDVSATGDVWLLYQDGPQWWLRLHDGCATLPLPFAWKPAVRAHDAGASTYGFDTDGTLLQVEVDADCDLDEREVAPPARKAELVDVRSQGGASAMVSGRWSFPTNWERFGDVEKVECE